MLKYLTQHPEKGLLGYATAGLTVIQYWRSFEHLEAFAKDTDDPHLEVWRNYWRRVGKGTRTGIWHETYLVRVGEYEAIYSNMPPHGLGKAAKLVSVADSVGARQRIKATRIDISHFRSHARGRARAEGESLGARSTRRLPRGRRPDRRGIR